MIILPIAWAVEGSFYILNQFYKHHWLSLFFLPTGHDKFKDMSMILKLMRQLFLPIVFNILYGDKNKLQQKTLSATYLLKDSLDENFFMNLKEGIIKTKIVKVCLCYQYFQGKLVRMVIVICSNYLTILVLSSRQFQISIFR